ncbi:MAG: prolyl oligopeptidase family serine peptidase [Anaerolineae bacterium]|nr:prolyl oligopeptidase family serine peptidase [Anaerolineae bacterium]
MGRKELIRNSIPWLLFGGLASLVLSLCLSRQVEKEPAAPSRIQTDTLQPGNRRYTIAVPADYTGDRRVSLVLALHYGGHGTPYYGRDFLTGLVEPTLRELGAIIVAPDCTGSDWTQPNSEQDVLDLLDHVEAAYNVDSSKTLVTGYSMGGIGTWHLAARHQDRFAAALPMAANPPSSALDTVWHIPLYVIHGSQDELFPLGSTQTTVDHLVTGGVSVELVVVDGVTHYETHRFVEPLREAVPWIQEAWE